MRLIKLFLFVSTLISCNAIPLRLRINARKVSRYGVFSGPYCPVFGPEKTPYLDTFYAVYVYQNT